MNRVVGRPNNCTRSASVVCPMRIWWIFSWVMDLGNDAQLVRQLERRMAVTRNLVFIFVAPDIVHKIAAGCSKSFQNLETNANAHFVGQFRRASERKGLNWPPASLVS